MNQSLDKFTVGRKACAFFIVAISCIVVTACGGGSARADGQGTDAASSRSSVSAVTAAANTGASSPVAPPVTPPPRTPSVGQQLLAQVVQLEQQGVLPNLDRGTDIAGPDVDNNGIRDDIDAYVASLKITDLQRKAVLQRARAQQAKLLLDPTDKQAVSASSSRSMAAANCMWDRFNGRDDLSKRIEGIIANTPERGKRFLRYMAALNGTSVWAPDGDTCEP